MEQRSFFFQSYLSDNIFVKKGDMTTTILQRLWKKMMLSVILQS